MQIPIFTYLLLHNKRIKKIAPVGESEVNTRQEYHRAQVSVQGLFIFNEIYIN